MAYKRKPIYEFEDEDSTGMSKVPNGSKIVVKNYYGKPTEFTKDDPTGLLTDPNMTVGSIVTGSTTPTGNTQGYTAAEIDARIQATLPFSGYTDKKSVEDNFVFRTASDYTYKVGDKNRFIKFGSEVVDTYGPELVVNGDFSDGTAGWSNTEYSTVVNVNNKLKIINENVTQGRVYQNIPTEIGKTYRIEFYVEQIDADYWNVIVWDGDTIVKSFGNLTSYGLHSMNFVATSLASKIGLYCGSNTTGSDSIYYDNISVREIQTADFSNSVDGTNCVPTVTVVGFDPISTGSITGNHVLAETDEESGLIGDILDVPAVEDNSASIRIKCRVKPTTDGIRIDILEGDDVVRTQSVNGTDTETLTFTLPANDDGYKVKATKITNDGIDDGDDDTEDASEDIQVVAEVSTGLTVDSAVNKGDVVVVDKCELVTNGGFDSDLSGWEVIDDATFNDGRCKIDATIQDSAAVWQYAFPITGQYIIKADIVVEAGTAKIFTNSHEIYETGITGNLHFEKTVSITAGEKVWLARDNGDCVAYFDNISVQLANDKFKAIENASAGDSLGSSKFKQVDYISNQALAYHRYNPLTKVYDGIVTEVMMNDAWAKDSTTKIMTDNGFSSLGGGLFSKGAYLCVPVGYAQL